MTTLPPDLEALMPKPAVRDGDYAGPPGEGASEDYFTTDQVRAVILAATERAAKKCEERATAYRTTRAPGWHEVDHECTQCAAAIRGDGGGQR